MLNPAEFVSQVRRELQRVTWPTQQETTAMTISVVAMVVCAMIYFLLADSAIYFCINKILGI